MKRAIAVTELMIIFLAIVAGVSLIFFTKQMVEKAGCQRDVDLCRQSHLLFKRAKQVFVTPRLDCVAVSPPNCGQKELEVKGSSEDKKQRALHIIAENLRWCWHKTLGRENTMGKDFARGWDNVDLCLVCSEFVMPDDVSISSAEWKKYVLERQIPGSQMTYAEFVNPVDDGIFGKSYLEVDFNAGKKYFVVAVSAEETRNDNQGRVYIDSEVYCGDADPQVHYQLK